VDPYPLRKKSLLPCQKDNSEVQAHRGRLSFTEIFRQYIHES